MMGGDLTALVRLAGDEEADEGFVAIDRVQILYTAYKSLELLAPANIVANAAVFKSIVVGEVSQYALIGCVERHFGVEKPELSKAIPLILKAFYDEDILADMVLVQWFDGFKTEFSPPEVNDEILEAVKEKAKVFIEWMKNLESSSDSSDDDDDDE